MMPRVYLAGPDVFLRDPVAWLARKQAICTAYGLVGVSPLDQPEMGRPEWASLPPWRQIALQNEARIRSCAAVVANLTPFRGPSADAGTVYEVGYARGLGRKVFGYATVAAPFLERTLALMAGCQDPDGSWWDPDNLLIEQFGLLDNLMIEAAFADTGGVLADDSRDRWHDLDVFERCVRHAARVLVEAEEPVG